MGSVAIDMIKVLVILSLLAVTNTGLPVPRTTGLVPGSAAEADWYQHQLSGKMKRSPNDDNNDDDDDDDDDDNDNDDRFQKLLTPLLRRMKRVPGTVPESAAEAQWNQQQLALTGRKKRSPNDEDIFRDDEDDDDDDDE